MVRFVGNKIYKYVGPGYIDKVFCQNELVTLKCSYPKDFNDPYELFLTIDFDEKPEVLAFYADIVGEMPQLPTTCFSLSPSVIPMWAHYANNHQGFAIEFDEDELSRCFPKSGFGDVDYQDEPEEGLTELLYRAYSTLKPRHTYMLRQGIFSAAYYTKASCWSYEKERRMIVADSEVRRIDDLILMDVPKSCVSALVVGPRASSETARAVRDKASQLGCDCLDLKVGRASAVPFFLDSAGNSLLFNGGRIQRAKASCATCKEPIESDLKYCPWCHIDESHRYKAAIRNPYRLLAHHGMLESYVEEMDAISDKFKNSRV